MAKLKEKSHGLRNVIRFQVGLDQEAAMLTFSEFISGSTAKPSTIECINFIVQERTQDGLMEP